MENIEAASAADGYLSHEIARAVLRDLATSGRLSVTTTEVLLSIVSKQPWEKAEGEATPQAGKPRPVPARPLVFFPHRGGFQETVPPKRSAEVRGEAPTDSAARIAAFTATMCDQRVRHVRRGTSYRVVGMARLQTEETLGDTARVVVYQGDDGLIWARPPHEMWDGRFVHAAGPVGPAVPGDDA